METDLGYKIQFTSAHDPFLMPLSLRRGTDSAAAFLHRLTEKHELGDMVFLVGGYVYMTAASRLALSGQLDYAERNLIEKWYHFQNAG